MLGSLKKLSGMVEKGTCAVGIVLFIVMLASALVQVVGRYVFSLSPPWTEELCRYCFVWINATGASVCYKHGAHAAVDFHIKLMPRKIANVFFLFGHLCVLVSGLLMLVQGFKVSLVTAAQPSAIMHLPMSFVYSSVAVAGLLLCIHGAYLLLSMLDKEYFHPLAAGTAGDAGEGGTL